MTVTAMERVRKLFPVTRWLPQYSRGAFVGDCIGAVAMSAVVIPQSMALAQVARIPVKQALYASMAGLLAYTVFGGAKDVWQGPTALLALCTANSAAGDTNKALILTMGAGLLQGLVGLLRWGFLTQFVSQPVRAGYNTAAAITLVTSQVSLMFGGLSESVAWREQIVNSLANLGDTRLADALMGGGALLLLLACAFVRDRWGARSYVALGIGHARYALVTALGIIIAYALHRRDEHPFTLIRAFGATGFPDPTVNPQIKGTDVNPLYAPMALMALVALTETEAVSRTYGFEGRYAKFVDADQECVANAACSVVSYFFRGCIPVAGCPVRARFSADTSAQTPLSGSIGAALIVVLLYWVTPCLAYVPVPVLCACVVSTAPAMFDVRCLVDLWRLGGAVGRRDAVGYVAAFLTALLAGVEWGVLVGVWVSLIALLLIQSAPHFSVLHRLKYASAAAASGAAGASDVEVFTSKQQYLMYTQSAPDTPADRNGGVLVFRVEGTLVFSSVGHALAELDRAGRDAFPVDRRALLRSATVAEADDVPANSNGDAARRPLRAKPVPVDDFDFASPRPSAAELLSYAGLRGLVFDLSACTCVDATAVRELRTVAGQQQKRGVVLHCAAALLHVRAALLDTGVFAESQMHLTVADAWTHTVADVAAAEAARVPDFSLRVGSPDTPARGDAASPDASAGPSAPVTVRAAVAAERERDAAAVMAALDRDAALMGGAPTPPRPHAPSALTTGGGAAAPNVPLSGAAALLLGSTPPVSYGAAFAAAAAERKYGGASGSPRTALSRRFDGTGAEDDAEFEPVLRPSTASVGAGARDVAMHNPSSHDLP